MNIFYKDYTETFYSRVARTAMPQNRTGKFVQIRHGNAEYLLFSPKEFTPYHAQIVEHFCSERGIQGFFNEDIKRFDITELGWTVVGGGKFEINTAEKHLRLYDNSMAYGKFESRGLLRKLFQIRELTGYKVTIE